MPPLVQLLIVDFYPRPPRGGRRVYGPTPWPIWGISIHALREEGDECQCQTRSYEDKFLSTPSARRATGDAAGGTGGD